MLHFVIFFGSLIRAGTGETFPVSIVEDSADSTLNRLEYEFPLSDVIRAKRQGARACQTELFSALDDPVTRHYRAIEFEPVPLEEEKGSDVYVSQSHSGRNYYYSRQDGSTQVQQSNSQSQPTPVAPKLPQPPNPPTPWQSNQFNPYWYQAAQQNYQPIKPFQGPVRFPPPPSIPINPINANNIQQYIPSAIYPNTEIFTSGSSTSASQREPVYSKPQQQYPPSKPILEDQGSSQPPSSVSPVQSEFQPSKPVPNGYDQYTLPNPLVKPVRPRPIPQNGFLHYAPLTPPPYESQAVPSYPEQDLGLELRPTLICQYVLQPPLSMPGYGLPPPVPGPVQDPKPKPDGQNEPQTGKPTPSVQGQQQISKPSTQDDFEDYASKLRPIVRGRPYQFAPSSSFQPLNPASPWSSDGYDQYGRLFSSGQEFYGVPVWLYFPVEQKQQLQPVFASPGPQQSQLNSVSQKLILSDGPASELKDQVVAVHGFQSATKTGLTAPASVQESRQAYEPYSIYAENEDLGLRETEPFSRCAGMDEYDRAHDHYEPVILVNKNLQDKIGGLMESVIAC